MIYLKSGKQTVADSSLTEWGSFVRYLEIADDGYASRQLDVFVNGCILAYDRESWCDAESTLVDKKYDAESWADTWGPHQEITEPLFEIEWEFAPAAANQPQDYDEEAGPWPVLAVLEGEGEVQ